VYVDPPPKPTDAYIKATSAKRLASQIIFALPSSPD
jgi:hypothetical protein